MKSPLYLIGRIVVAIIQRMPLLWVAQVGRMGGEIVFWLDGRHRKMALRNLTFCFHPGKTRREIRSLALENFKRIGEVYCCSIKTAGMKDKKLRHVMEVSGLAAAEPGEGASPPKSRVYASGHFGNFELFSRLSTFVGGYQIASTYRGLRPEALNQIVCALRTGATDHCLMFERRTDAEALKKAMSHGGMLLVLFSDQSARENGLKLPFFGRSCFTSRAPAVMAARYDCDLFVPICYRTSIGHWRIEVGERIPMRENGTRRSTEAITRDINTVMEAAIRRDPANWFWVHNRWKMKRLVPKKEELASSSAMTGSSIGKAAGSA